MPGPVRLMRRLAQIAQPAASTFYGTRRMIDIREQPMAAFLLCTSSIVVNARHASVAQMAMSSILRMRRYCDGLYSE